MKVAICALNSQYIHSSLAPWCLLAGIKEYANVDAIDAHVIEGTINEKEDVLFQRIVNGHPDVIGFCTYIWNVELVTILAKRIKLVLPKTIIIVGGPEVGYRAESVLSQYDDIDFVMSGEGEYPFAKFLNHLLFNQKNFMDVPGLCFRTADNTYHIAEPYLPTNDPVSPYCDEYFKQLNGRLVYLETSRGCPYSCAFCLSGRCGGVRFFDTEKAKENMILLANSGAKTIKLVDRTFNADKKRAYELFSFIINEYGKKIPKGVCFHFEIAGDILDDKILNLLNSAPKGSIQMEIGLQSFNSKTLEAVVRKTNIERLVENIKTLLKPRNIHVHIDLIVGLPYEDFESFRHSFNLAYDLHPDMLQFGFLKLLFGAPMRENKEKYPCVYSDKPPYQVIETPWLSKDEIETLSETESVFDRLYNSGRFHYTIAYAREKLQITPFDIFLQFSKYLKQIHKNKISIPLDEFTNILYDFLTSYPVISKNELRDIMICDRFSTNSSNIIPESLKIQDPNLKKLRAFLNNNDTTKIPLHGKRSVAILYSQQKIVYVDYDLADEVTGKYKLQFLPFTAFESETEN